ncbi:sulfotransferase family protein [Halobacillus ihumii]|uniref:sulfotransferase family protein n=1 Tax=Halobacillus ihumii TaxID=2686092 RepID=UPI0013D80826|nr:sulfotransferase [Halobacillus ihumii]
MNQEPVFILGAHKSGTSLLRSLFDGHPGLFVIPIEAHFFQHLGDWIDYGIRRQMPEGNISKEEIFNNFIDWIDYSNKNYEIFSDSDTRGKWNIESLKEYIWQEFNDIRNEKEIIELFVRSMYFSLYGKEMTYEKRIIEKSVENAEFALNLKALYPRAKFIHIVRNPYSNIVSIRKFKTYNNKYPSLKPIVRSLYNTYYFLDKNKKIIRDDYLIIKYEDLVEDPDKTISLMAKFLQIDEEEILFIPTSDGEIWQGNSTTSKKFKGISSKSIGNFKKNIYPIEIELVNKLFSQVISKYNYKFMDAKSYVLPNKKESIKKYISNRLLLKYFL